MSARTRGEPDWYAVLGVGAEASEAEVKEAHRRLARTWHPDTNASPAAHARMVELNRARDVLLDPRQRAAFDEARRLRQALRAKSARPRPAPPAAPRQPAPEPEDAHMRPGPAVGPPDFSTDWYLELLLRPSATTAEVRAALGRAAAALEHEPVSAVVYAERRQRLRRAWATLGDPATRAAYDRVRADR